METKEGLSDPARFAGSAVAIFPDVRSPRQGIGGRQRSVHAMTAILTAHPFSLPESQPESPLKIADPFVTGEAALANLKAMLPAFGSKGPVTLLESQLEMVQTELNA